MHSAYRKAKKFKLDEDGNVNDIFTGTRKRQVRRGWDEGGSFWDTIKPLYQFLRSKVGEPWDKVYSLVCSRAKQYDAQTGQEIRDQVRRQVEMNVFADDDGTLFYYSRGRKYKAEHGQLYVYNGILCRAPTKKRQKYRYNPVRRKWDDCKHLEVGDVTYVQRKQEYNLRVAPGVFKVVTEVYWQKLWTTRRPATRMVSNHVRNSTNTGWTVESYSVEPYMAYVHHCGTASKKAIKKYKLNELE